MTSKKIAAIAIIVMPLLLVALFALACVLGGCFLWNQDPVCPPSKPYCLNDDDPTIWKPHGSSPDAGDARSGG